MPCRQNATATTTSWWRRANQVDLSARRRSNGASTAYQRRCKKNILKLAPFASEVAASSLDIEKCQEPLAPAAPRPFDVAQNVKNPLPPRLPTFPGTPSFPGACRSKPSRRSSLSSPRKRPVSRLCLQAKLPGQASTSQPLRPGRDAVLKSYSCFPRGLAPRRAGLQPPASASSLQPAASGLRASAPPGLRRPTSGVQPPASGVLCPASGASLRRKPPGASLRRKPIRPGAPSLSCPPKDLSPAPNPCLQVFLSDPGSVALNASFFCLRLGLRGGRFQQFCASNF